MKLDLTALRKSLDALERALNVVEKKENEVNLPKDEFETLRAGVIQCFEFSYEQCWKFMRRWLLTNLGASFGDGVSRRELFRLSAENGLIKNIEQWFEYNDARNTTSHNYSESHAARIFRLATPFLEDARLFLSALEQRND